MSDYRCAYGQRIGPLFRVTGFVFDYEPDGHPILCHEFPHSFSHATGLIIKQLARQTVP